MTTQHPDGERQVALLTALSRLKDIIDAALLRNFPHATEEKRKHATLDVMVSMVDDGKLQVYLDTEPTEPPAEEGSPHGPVR